MTSSWCEMRSNQIAFSRLTEKVHLEPVEVTTRGGDVYRMPAMDVEMLQKVLPKGSNRAPEGMSTLALVNASMSVLSIPFQIVKTIRVGEEEWWWCCPA